MQARFFEGIEDMAGRTFRELHFLFLGMLFPANMPTNFKWMPRVRIYPHIRMSHWWWTKWYTF